MEPAAVIGPRIKVPLLLLVAFLLHHSVFAAVHLGDVRPELMLLVAVAAGLVGGPERGAVVGFVAGLLTDVFLQTPLGLSALTFTIVAFAVGRVQAGLMRLAWWIVPLSAFWASAAGVLLYAVLGAIIGRSHFVRPQLLLVTAIVAAVNAVTAPFLVRAMAWAMAAPAQRSFAR
jgi:rod shape-determining protein MreD